MPHDWTPEQARAEAVTRLADALDTLDEVLDDLAATAELLRIGGQTRECRFVLDARETLLNDGNRLTSAFTVEPDTSKRGAPRPTVSGTDLYDEGQP